MEDASELSLLCGNTERVDIDDMNFCLPINFTIFYWVCGIVLRNNSYSGDCSFVIKIKGFKAGIRDVQLRGLLRVELRPLTKQIPLVGGVTACFLRPPVGHHWKWDACLKTCC